MAKKAGNAQTKVSRPTKETNVKSGGQSTQASKAASKTTTLKTAPAASTFKKAPVSEPKKRGPKPGSKRLTGAVTGQSTGRAALRGKLEDGSPHPIDIHVGSRLRLRRSLIRMSQQKLADAVGVTFQQVQKYERGTNRISISRMYEMANALGVPASYFLEDLPHNMHGAAHSQIGFAEEAQAVFKSDPLHRKETRDLIRAYYNITDSILRKRLLDLAKTMANSIEKDD